MAGVIRLSAVFAFLVGACGVRFSLRAPKDAKDDDLGNRTWDGNPNCIPRAGGRCFNGPSDCQPWTACSKDFFCVCHHWGCADATGTCRPQFNKWLTTWTGAMAEARLVPAMLKTVHLTMPADGATPPGLKEGFPANDEPEGLWNFLLQPDNATVMITTRLNRHQTHKRHTAYGYFLSVNQTQNAERTLLETLSGKNQMKEGYGHLEPIQARPEDALSAAWQFVSRPAGRVALQHIQSRMYLSVSLKYSSNGTLNQGTFGTCAYDTCGQEEADFNLWPELTVPLDGHPMPPAGQGHMGPDNLTHDADSPMNKTATWPGGDRPWLVNNTANNSHGANAPVMMNTTIAKAGAKVVKFWPLRK